MRNIAYSKSAPDWAGPWVNPIRQLERDVKAHTFPIRVPAQPCRVHSSRATRQRQLRPRFRIRARGPRGRSRTPIWLVATYHIRLVRHVSRYSCWRQKMQ